MSRTNGRGIGSRTIGAVVIVASTLMFTVIVGGTGHLDSAGAVSSTAPLKVCDEGNVSGGLLFSVNHGGSFLVPVGECLIEFVPPGENVVTELVGPTGTGLQSIGVTPTSASVAHQVQNSSTQAGYAKVKAASGAVVVVLFTNAPGYGQLKVCKVAAANTPFLIGQSFSFTERTTNSHVGPFSVVAAAKPDTSCGGLTRYRIGTRVNISETATAGTQVTNVAVTGGTLSSWSGLNATAIVGPSTVTTVVNFTNGIISLINGFIEVCVQPGDSSVQGTFYFDLSSGQWSGNGVPVTVSPGNIVCTGDIPTPVGQVTVSEESNPAYDVSSVAAIPTGDLVSENLVSQTATFSVPFLSNGATVAIFTNSTVAG